MSNLILDFKHDCSLFRCKCSTTAIRSKRQWRRRAYSTSEQSNRILFTCQEKRTGCLWILSLILTTNWVGIQTIRNKITWIYFFSYLSICMLWATVIFGLFYNLVLFNQTKFSKAYLKLKSWLKNFRCSKIIYKLNLRSYYIILI